MLINKKPDVNRVLRDPSDYKAVLIFGPERGLVRERAAEILKVYADRVADPFCYARLDEDGADEATVVNELSAQSLTGDKRLVHMQLQSETKAFKDLAQVVEQHLDGTLNPDTVLLIEAPNLRKDNALRSLCEKQAQAAAMPCYEDRAQDSAQLVRERLGQEQIQIEPEALQLFLAECPPNRDLVKQEVEKLALYAGQGGRITAADVQTLTVADGDSDAFGAVFMALSGDVKTTFRQMDQALASGMPPAILTRILGQHIAKLRRAQADIAGGKSPKDAAKAQRIFWKQEQDFLKQLRIWPAAQLRALSQQTVDTDVAVKRHYVLAETLVMRHVLQAAARARRAR